MRLTIDIDDDEVRNLLDGIIPSQLVVLPQLSEIVKEAAVDLYLHGQEEFSAADIYRKATQLFGREVNRQSLSLRVVGCTPNHTSFKHAVTKRDYFKHTDRGKYTLSDVLLKKLKEKISCPMAE